jgi:hypothetical protein
MVGAAKIAVLSACLLAASRLVQSASASQFDRYGLINMFAKATQLNHAFAADEATLKPEERTRRRHEVESYEEDVVDSHLAECLERLSAESDNELALAFFRFVASNENSADEEPMWTLGRLFLNNPNLVESNFAALSTSERRVV